MLIVNYDSKELCDICASERDRAIFGEDIMHRYATHFTMDNTSMEVISKRCEKCYKNCIEMMKDFNAMKEGKYIEFPESDKNAS